MPASTAWAPRCRQGALFYVSGQVGVDSRGKLQPASRSRRAGLEEHRPGAEGRPAWATSDIVKINTFLTDSRFVVPYRAARDRFIPAQPYPASTLLIVAGLADPAMLVEIEVACAA